MTRRWLSDSIQLLIASAHYQLEYSVTLGVQLDSWHRGICHQAPDVQLLLPGDDGASGFMAEWGECGEESCRGTAVKSLCRGS